MGSPCLGRHGKGYVCEVMSGYMGQCVSVWGKYMGSSVCVCVCVCVCMFRMCACSE